MRNKKIIWITQTALLIALVVLAQLLSKVVPQNISQFVTGSLVNLVLIIGAFVPGFASAATAALISPILAAFFGIIPGHLPQMVPVVMAGNLTIVFITWLFSRASHGLGKPSAAALNVIGVVAGALLKSLVMWGATTKIIIPVFHVAAKLAKALIMVVSLPQFITGVIGGVLALLIMPAVRSASKGRR